MKIRSVRNGIIIYEDDSGTMRETLINAMRKEADLSGADLRGAYLSGADLRGAYLSGADLSRAYLREADLSGADLRGADLSRADLSGADLSGADLRGAYLSGADLMVSQGLHYAQMSFTGFGESNRLITLADISRDGNPIFFCGCFDGTNEELISYIENGYVSLKESRHFARKTLLEVIKFRNNTIKNK